MQIFLRSVSVRSSETMYSLTVVRHSPHYPTRVELVLLVLISFPHHSKRRPCYYRRPRLSGSQLAICSSESSVTITRSAHFFRADSWGIPRQQPQMPDPP